MTPVPDYLFTAQEHPRGGLCAFRSIANKPVLPYLIWHLLTLAVLAGAAFSAFWKPERRATLLRTMGLAACLALLFGFGVSDSVMYSLSYHDTPVAATVLVASTLFVFIMIRSLGMPGEIGLAKGTTWASLVLVAATAGLSALWMYSSQRGFVVGKLGLSSWHMAFGGPIILNVGLLALGSAVASELVFRGYLYGILEKHLSSIQVVIGVQALISSLYGLPILIYSEGLSLRMIVQFTGVCIGAVALGTLRRRYTNLLVPSLVHFAWNAALYYMICASALAATLAVDKFSP
jgi:membrane protease YdiL (CAAX protease family)